MLVFGQIEIMKFKINANTCRFIFNIPKFSPMCIELLASSVNDYDKQLYMYVEYESRSIIIGANVQQV